MFGCHCQLVTVDSDNFPHFIMASKNYAESCDDPPDRRMKIDGPLHIENVGLGLN